METIKIDTEVMNYLKSKADPFNDTPNSVLRRVLGLDKKIRINNLELNNRDFSKSLNSDDFVKKIISEHFGYENRPKKVGKFRYMYDLDGKYVYFQNFNEHTNNLWYRLRSNAIDELKRNKNSEIVLTHPIAGNFYIIEVSELLNKLNLNNWTREDIEVNIDPDQDYWRELNWKLRKHSF